MLLAIWIDKSFRAFTNLSYDLRMHISVLINSKILNSSNFFKLNRLRTKTLGSPSMHLLHFMNLLLRLLGLIKATLSKRQSQQILAFHFFNFHHSSIILPHTPYRHRNHPPLVITILNTSSLLRISLISWSLLCHRRPLNLVWSQWFDSIQVWITPFISRLIFRFQFVLKSWNFYIDWQRRVIFRHHYRTLQRHVLIFRFVCLKIIWCVNCFVILLSCVQTRH